MCALHSVDFASDRILFHLVLLLLLHHHHLLLLPLSSSSSSMSQSSYDTKTGFKGLEGFLLSILSCICIRERVISAIFLPSFFSFSLSSLFSTLLSSWNQSCPCLFLVVLFHCGPKGKIVFSVHLPPPNSFSLFFFPGWGKKRYLIVSCLYI